MKIPKLVYDKDPSSICTRGQKVRKFDGPVSASGVRPVLFSAALNSQEKRNYRRKIAN